MQGWHAPKGPWEFPLLSDKSLMSEKRQGDLCHVQQFGCAHLFLQYASLSVQTIQPLWLGVLQTCVQIAQECYVLPRLLRIYGMLAAKQEPEIA